MCRGYAMSRMRERVVCSLLTSVVNQSSLRSWRLRCGRSRDLGYILAPHFRHFAADKLFFLYTMAIELRGNSECIFFSSIAGEAEQGMCHAITRLPAQNNLFFLDFSLTASKTRCSLSTWLRQRLYHEYQFSARFFSD